MHELGAHVEELKNDVDRLKDDNVALKNKVRELGGDPSTVVSSEETSTQQPSTSQPASDSIFSTATSQPSQRGGVTDPSLITTRAKGQASVA